MKDKKAFVISVIIVSVLFFGLAFLCFKAIDKVKNYVSEDEKIASEYYKRHPEFNNRPLTNYEQREMYENIKEIRRALD